MGIATVLTLFVRELCPCNKGPASGMRYPTCYFKPRVISSQLCFNFTCPSSLSTHAHVMLARPGPRAAVPSA